jgi:hypothetical protein
MGRVAGWLEVVEVEGRRAWCLEDVDPFTSVAHQATFHTSSNLVSCTDLFLYLYEPALLVSRATTSASKHVATLTVLLDTVDRTT